MARLTQCENGHYYDSEMNERCPYCGGEGKPPEILIEKGIDPPPEILWDPPQTIYCPPPPKPPEPPRPSREAVGCLIAVSGPHRGECFPLREGDNWIGRWQGDIVLSKDKYVSGVRKPGIRFSERNKSFTINDGESSNIVYINDEELLSGENVQLKPFDLIEIGKSRLRLVPFEEEDSPGYPNI